MGYSKINNFLLNSCGVTISVVSNYGLVYGIMNETKKIETKEKNLMNEKSNGESKN